MAKRIMCLIISVLMIVSLLPTTVFAEVDEDSSTPVAVAEEEDSGDDAGDGDTSADSTGETNEANYGIMLTEGLDEGGVEGGEIAIPDDTVEIQREGYTISAPTLCDISDEIEDGDTITLIANVEETGTVTITASNVTIDLAGYTLVENVIVSSGASVTFTDISEAGTGTYTGTLTVTDGGSLTITGGTYSFDVSSYATGYTVTYNEDGTYTVSEVTVSYVATVASGSTTTYYETFDEAIAAATTDGDTIMLLSDATWTLTANKTINYGLTFDLNGHTLTMNGNYYVGFQPADSTSTVAFVDNSTSGGGKVAGAYTGTSNGMIRVTKACSVVLKNVTFENTSAGYILGLGTSGGIILDVDAQYCNFINKNAGDGNAVMVNGNSYKATTEKISFYECKFETEGTGTGSALLIRYGGGTADVINIKNCTIISAGTSTSAYALNLSSSLKGTVSITDTTITANDGACAVFFNYSISSDAEITFDDNVVTGMLRFGNGSSAAYKINIAGGCFKYTVDNVAISPFVAATDVTTTPTAVGITSLLNLTGGYFTVDVSDVVANGYQCVANDADAGDTYYNATYATNGYVYVVVPATTTGNCYVVSFSDGGTTYYNDLAGAIAAASGNDTVYFTVDSTLTSTEIGYINSKNLTVTNRGSVTLTYGDTLSALVSALTSGTVSVETLAYKYSDTKTHSMTNAVITSGVLTGGVLPDMTYGDLSIWNYYTGSNILTDAYVFYNGSSGWAVGSASDSYAVKVDNAYFINSSNKISLAITAGIKLNELDDTNTHTITLLTDVSADIQIATAGAELNLDLGENTLYGYIYVYKDNVDVTISNGSITNNNSEEFVIYANGQYTGDNWTLTNVTLTNTEGYVMYLAADGETTITNCTITGVQSGIEVRAGDLTITNSTITATDTGFSTDNNNSGTTVIGAGIAVSQHTTDKEINVTITDSEISGYYGIFEVNYNSDNTSNVNITISGDKTKVSGTGAEAVYSVSVSGAGSTGADTTTYANTTVAISCGSFSSAVPDAYCATGYLPTEQLTDGTYSVYQGIYLGISTDETTKVPATIVSGEGTATMYVKVSADNISNYSTDAYPTTTLTYTTSSSVDSGKYIFAGWYSLAEDGSYTACGEDMWTSSDPTEYYAKFVDANVLSVSVQVPSDASTNSPTSMRLISTVDSEYYGSVGFEVYIGTNTNKISVVSGTVYEAITGADETYTPDTICSVSKYFATCSLTNIPQSGYDTNFKITAVWTTLDGTTVYGETRNLTVNEVLKYYSTVSG